jgi:hypothetical protein
MDLNKVFIDRQEARDAETSPHISTCDICRRKETEVVYWGAYGELCRTCVGSNLKDAEYSLEYATSKALMFTDGPMLGTPDGTFERLKEVFNGR